MSKLKNARAKQIKGSAAGISSLTYFRPLKKTWGGEDVAPRRVAVVPGGAAAHSPQPEGIFTHIFPGPGFWVLPSRMHSVLIKGGGKSVPKIMSSRLMKSQLEGREKSSPKGIGVTFLKMFNCLCKLNPREMSSAFSIPVLCMQCSGPSCCSWLSH